MDIIRLFQQMNAEAGIEMTLEEARIQNAACMVGIVALEYGSTVDEAVEMITEFDPEIHPGVLRKFLTQAAPLLNER